MLPSVEVVKKFLCSFLSFLSPNSFYNRLQSAALPDSLKADKADDSPVHAFEFVDYLTNTVWPNVPAESPIQSATLRYQLACTLIQNRETLTMMIVLERPLKDFLASEPDLHFPRDAKMTSHPELEP